jgi:hypothetical protein
MELGFNLSPERKFRGPSPDENEKGLMSRAKHLLGPYQENVAPLLQQLKTGHDHSEAYGTDARQIERVLESMAKGEVEPHRWPDGFVVPKYVRLVRLEKNGEAETKEFEGTDFTNPMKFIEAVEQFLMVSQIKGL